MPGFGPAGQLPAHVVGIDPTRQQEPSLEHGLITDDIDKVCEFHARIIPRMAYYRNEMDDR
jgi:hypothetical protein